MSERPSDGLETAVEMAKNGQTDASEEEFWTYIEQTSVVDGDDLVAWVDYVSALMERADYDRGVKLGLAFLDNVDSGQDDTQVLKQRVYQLLSDAARQKQDEDLLLNILQRVNQNLPADSIGRGAVLADFAPRQIDGWERDAAPVAPFLANYGNRHAARGNFQTAFMLWLSTTTDPAGDPPIDVAIVNAQICTAALRLAEGTDFDEYGTPEQSPRETLELLQGSDIYSEMPPALRSVLQAALGRSPDRDPSALRADAGMERSAVTVPVDALQLTNQEAVRRLAAAEVLEAL